LDCVSSHNSISRKEDFVDNYIELSKNNQILKTHNTMKILEVRNKGKQQKNEQFAHAIKTPIQTIKIEKMKEVLTIKESAKKVKTSYMI